MLDFFKEYAKEVGAGAILGDSFMMIIACLLSSNFATYNLNTNIIALVISLYFIPYMINYE
jgi:threonine/homoserine/homoserine lactone efflux protein